MSLAQVLVADVWASDYFQELQTRLESEVAQTFLLTSVQDSLSYSERDDLLRFADLLSYGERALDRNAAYRIVAQIAQLGVLDAQLSSYATAILSKLGNFPGLEHLRQVQGELPRLPVERELERAVKQLNQRSSDNKRVFTDAQFMIRKALDDHDFFSFSGPTSIGKSFILKDYIRSLAAGHELVGAAAVVLVPTRALITQMVADLREEIDDPQVHVGAFPQTSPLLMSRFTRTVYVFTPERLLRYLSTTASLPIRALFVDEAQKVASLQDERSSLYYHAIYETTRRYATQLIFASPNIPNPEIFLRIFDRDTSGRLAIEDRTVSQNRYFIDPSIGYASHFVPTEESGVLDERPISISLPRGMNAVITMLGDGASNLVYCNSTSNTVETALAFAKTRLPVSLTPSLESLISFATNFVHVDYYLIECLKRGVAFHHGRMPQEVRTRIEAIFLSGDGSLDYIFCTSTLLEGVNLPAKNIFVLTELRGRSPFSQVDFENLAGRAGRLTREFSGNVICTRGEAGRWNDKQLIAATKPAPAETFLTDDNPKRHGEFANIGRAIAGEKVAKGYNIGETANMTTFGSIVLLHHAEGESSPLLRKFLERNKNGSDVLAAADHQPAVPTDALRLSPSISAVYQRTALAYIKAHGVKSQVVPEMRRVDIAPMLSILYDLYNWEKEETGGRDPVIPPGLVRAGYGRTQLHYWSMVANHWIKAEPLSRIISYSIHFHQERGYIWFKQQGRLIREDFVRGPRHINIIIEQVMADIETGLRHRISRYLQNYHDLSRLELGDQAAPNWADLVEYGTIDRRAVSLQNSGFSRAAAKYLLERFPQYLQFDEQLELIDLDGASILAALPERTDTAEEIRAVLADLIEL